MSWLSRLFGTGRHSDSVRAGKVAVSKTLGGLATRAEKVLGPGGELSEQFGVQYENLGDTYRQKARELSANLAKMSGRSGLQTSGENESSAIFKDLLSRYKTEFSGLGLQQKQAERSFIDQMEERKRAILRDFQSATGYSYDPTDNYGGLTRLDRALRG